MSGAKNTMSRTGVCLLAQATALFAGGFTSRAEDQSVGKDRIQQAVESGLKTLEKSGAEYPERRTCFSCHHQTLPMQAMVVAREHGFKIDDGLLRAQTKLAFDSFKARRTNLNDGTGIGGRSMTVGFGLWALDLGAWETDDTTSAMIRFLLKDQAPDGHFSSNVSRPPLEDSRVTSTAVAAYYMQKYVGVGQKAEVDRAVNAAKQWLVRAPAESQEDRNSKLWGLSLLNGEEEHVEKARKAVLETQRTDGGWAQLESMDSDAYATGQTLFILQKSGTPVSQPAYQRGVRFLVETQLKDGTWYVKTRSKPIQTYFESGFPHGTDQFISICATSWAVAALAPVCSGEQTF